jgi:hypothetical protein
MYIPLSQLHSARLSLLLPPLPPHGSPAAGEPGVAAALLPLLLGALLLQPRESIMRPNQVSRLLANALGTQTTRYCMTAHTGHSSLATGVEHLKSLTAPVLIDQLAPPDAHIPIPH